MMKCKRQRELSDGGAVMVEAVFMMPMLLALTFGILQVGQLFIARQIVDYAAYCAARAVLVVPEGGDANAQANQAARRILCWLVNAPNSKKDGVQMPDCDSADVTSRILGVEVENESWNTRVKLTFACPMTIPVASQIIGYGLDLQTFKRGRLKSGMREMSLANETCPHVVFTETCVLPKPYKRVEKVSSSR